MVVADAKVWERAIRKLRGHLMPPPGNDQPDASTTRQLISWLEGSLDEAAQHHPRPGRVPLHRLNRKEYANAVRDLLDLRIEPSALLPSDDTSEGFDNIASALQVSPSFLDQYLGAARFVALQAVGDPSAKPLGTAYTVKGAGSQQFHREGLPLGTRGGMVVEHHFPADGEYAINIGNLASRPVGLRHGVSQHAGRRNRWPQSVRNESRRRGRSESDRPAAGSGGRRHQFAPEEHPVSHQRRSAQGRGDVRAPQLRRVGGPAARLCARRRPGSGAARSTRSRFADPST